VTIGRRRRALAAVGTSAALALATVSSCAATAASVPPTCPGCVIAGAGRAPLAVPDGTPLAGYGAFARRLIVPDVFGRYPHAFWFKPATRDGESLWARALVLERDDTRVIWVALDLVAVDGAFTETVGARLLRAGVRPGVLILSASHTHSGPGAFVDSALMGFLAADREDVAVRDALATAVVEAVRRADDARASARVAIGVTTAPPVVRSRLGGPLDPEIVVLAVRRVGGAPVAAVWNFAIHGTMLGANNLALSPDVMGAATDTLERVVGAPVLYVNGAVGDVSPARHGRQALVEVGAALAEAARTAWQRATPLGAGPLLARAQRISLPAPRLSLHNCLGRLLPAALTVPLDGAFPSETTLTAVALGDAAWVALPGEPATALGVRIKTEARRSFRHAFVAGLSNDYVGYLVTAADHGRPSYVTCASVYKAQTGDDLTERAIALLRELYAAGRRR
jgi:neutral ceramidase